VPYRSALVLRGRADRLLRDAAVRRDELAAPVAPHRAGIRAVLARLTRGPSASVDQELMARVQEREKIKRAQTG